MGAQEGKLDFRGMLTSELGCHLQYSGCQLELTYRVRRLQTTDEMGKMEMKAFGTCQSVRSKDGKIVIDCMSVIL